jgi:hypothetical protein
MIEATVEWTANLIIYAESAVLGHVIDVTFRADEPDGNDIEVMYGMFDDPLDALICAGQLEELPDVKRATVRGVFPARKETNP